MKSNENGVKTENENIESEENRRIENKPASENGENM
jgi:hypothetical protein